MEARATPEHDESEFVKSGITAGFDCFESPAAVVAGLVPATPNLKAQSKNNRGGRDKPGHDEREVDDRNRL